MAAAAPILIEAVAARIAAYLAAGAVAGAAGGAAIEEARRRKKAADDAATSPIARVDAQTETKTKKKCDKCPPDCGAASSRSTAGWSTTSIAYQERIGGMPAAAPGFITEWLFSGVTFDGFDSSQCLLKEAKAKYDQFFSDFGQPLKWWTENVDVMFNEAARQSAAARPRPPVRLKWHFMEPMSYRYFSRIIVAAFPDVEVVYQP